MKGRTEMTLKEALDIARTCIFDHDGEYAEALGIVCATVEKIIEIHDDIIGNKD